MSQAAKKATVYSLKEIIDAAADEKYRPLVEAAIALLSVNDNSIGYIHELREALNRVKGGL